MKHRAKRPVRPIARSVAPSSRAPASDVIVPPPKSATTLRPQTSPKAIPPALHSVCIGSLASLADFPFPTRTFADFRARCTYTCEICGLAPHEAAPRRVSRTNMSHCSLHLKPAHYDCDQEVVRHFLFFHRIFSQKTSTLKCFTSYKRYSHIPVAPDHNNTDLLRRMLHSACW